MFCKWFVTLSNDGVDVKVQRKFLIEVLRIIWKAKVTWKKYFWELNEKSSESSSHKEREEWWVLRYEKSWKSWSDKKWEKWWVLRNEKSWDSLSDNEWKERLIKIGVETVIRSMDDGRGGNYHSDMKGYQKRDLTEIIMDKPSSNKEGHPLFGWE